MITLEKKQENKEAEVYFGMFTRKQTGNPVFTPAGIQPITDCQRCHPNGLRAISPLGYHVRAGEAQLPEKNWFAAKAMNDAMEASAGYSLVNWRLGRENAQSPWKPMLRNKSISPPMGPVVPLNDIGRTEAFIMGRNGSGGCFNSRTTVNVVDIFGRAPGARNVYHMSANPSVRWEVVRENMNCTSCHDGKYRSNLSNRITPEEIDFKILVDQSMPMGAHVNPLDQGDANAPVHDALTPDERIALANCLKQEFALELKQVTKWLTQATCQ